jgi:excisionase family DNA binding protein
MTSKTDAFDSVLSEEEAEMTKTAQRCLMSALDHSRARKIVLTNEDSDDAIATLELPPKALRMIADLLGAMSQRQPVVLIPRGHEVTTQNAAAILNVSRPFVIKQIAEGKLPCRKVGRHRRIAFEDLARFQRDMKEASESALQDLADDAQKLNLGY